MFGARSTASMAVHESDQGRRRRGLRAGAPGRPSPGSTARHVMRSAGMDQRKGAPSWSPALSFSSKNRRQEPRTVAVHVLAPAGFQNDIARTGGSKSLELLPAGVDDGPSAAALATSSPSAICSSTADLQRSSRAPAPVLVDDRDVRTEATISNDQAPPRRWARPALQRRSIAHDRPAVQPGDAPRAWR